ncbi:phage portal protein [Kineococcus radiotolerans]|uniref:Portal protein n=1 Tax=Kineococcus radiotolerans (strain ATCC BAA-149 / DSM 14245 / SRS30216) TaxID=266940 RepID=A6W8R9_KINRD|nr:phage portal protein [Kineococcus radiotolerans]ABS03208.1 hypothetical protein Krad_1722 [Kineococcus radiotolerans SRS30216 = ATCC BAA-149]
MVLAKASVVELVHDVLWPEWEQQRQHLDWIDRWARWVPDEIKLPRTATAEHKRLAELSNTPWLSLVVTTTAQCLGVDSLKSSRDIGRDLDPQERGPWRTWVMNRFDQRQNAIHRAALTYGTAYNKIMPGQDQRSGEPMAVMRGVSPRRMLALYRDPAEDDWAEYTIEVGSKGSDDLRLVEVMDDEAVYRVSLDASTGKIEYIDDSRHEVGVVPVVRYTNMLDLDGRSFGEVEPFIVVAARANKTLYDRLLVQHFSSWKIRTVAGMAKPEDDEEAARAKLQLRQDDLLVADDPDTKFGTLDETPLGGFLDAERQDRETLSAVSQTPSYAFGPLINLSADAISAAKAGQTQKVAERQKSFGSSHVQSARLAAAEEGDEDIARDVQLRVGWQDLEIRSISQAVDALGKAAQMLQVPPQALWSRIPGVEKSDVDEWAAMSRSSDPTTSMMDKLERQFGLGDE